MAVGPFVYVGRSRLRKKKRKKVQSRKEDKRIQQAEKPLLLQTYVDDQKHAGGSDCDSISTSSAESEDSGWAEIEEIEDDLFPLLDLRPHAPIFNNLHLGNYQYHYTPIVSKMPFGPFKKKEEKKTSSKKFEEDEPVVIESSNKNEKPVAKTEKDKQQKGKTKNQKGKDDRNGIETNKKGDTEKNSLVVRNDDEDSTKRGSGLPEKEAEMGLLCCALM